MVSDSLAASAAVCAVPAVVLARWAAVVMLTANVPTGEFVSAARKLMFALSVEPLVPEEPFRMCFVWNWVFAAMRSMVSRALVIWAWLAAKALASLAPLLADDRARDRICVS